MYIKIKAKSKTPVEHWRECQYTREELEPWIQAGGNIGFACGDQDIVVLDIDNAQSCIRLKMKPILDTYIVQTGSGGEHLYYKVPNCPIMRLYDPEANGPITAHIADVQALGTYVVAPPSIHPNGESYSVITDSPIATLSMEEFEGMLGNVTIGKSTQNENKKIEYLGDREWKIDQVWDLGGFKRVGEQLVGPHPNHGSSTGHNLVIDQHNNQWWCGRHRTGGGPYQALAVDEGIIDCGDSVQGCLYGKRWLALVRAARRRGLI